MKYPSQKQLERSGRLVELRLVDLWQTSTDTDIMPWMLYRASIADTVHRQVCDTLVARCHYWHNTYGYLPSCKALPLSHFSSRRGEEFELASVAGYEQSSIISVLQVFEVKELRRCGQITYGLSDSYEIAAVSGRLHNAATFLLEH